MFSSRPAEMIGLGGHHRIDPDILRRRVQGREQRESSDTRTEARIWGRSVILGPEAASLTNIDRSDLVNECQQRSNHIQSR